MKINRVLVTGSNGFVGKHLCRRLTEIGIDVATNDKDENKLNVTDMDQLRSIDNNVEAIIHLGAKTWIRNWRNSPYEFYYTNLLGTLNLLELARLKNIRKFINISTYVYGQPKYLPIDEKHPVNPHYFYNKSKLLSEVLCENYSHDFGINVVTLRPFYLYGPESNPDSFVPSVIQQIKKNGEVVLSGVHIKRDFLFISDFINLLVIISNTFPNGYNVYNVGSGMSFSLEEATEIIAKLLEKEITINYDLQSRPGDIIDMKADVSRVSNTFNWKPVVSIDHGLKLTVQNSA